MKADDDRRARDYAFTIAVTLIALLPRLFVAIAWAREPVWDGHYYHFGATRLAEGLGYSEDVLVDGVRMWKPWCHYPVGYSALLSLFYRVFGSGLVVAPVVNAVVGALVVTTVHRLTRRHIGEVRARIAATLVALHPGLIAYTATVMSEGIASLLILAALYAAVRWRGSWHGAAVAGLVLGLATLVRASALLVVPLIALATPPPRRVAIGRTALAGALALVVVLPWSMRNCRVMDGCALVSTNGGWNLAIGTITETGRFTTLRATDGCPVVTGQVQQDRCWASVGLRRIKSDPLAWLAKLPDKLGQTFDHESFAIEYLREADPAAWPEARRVAGRRLLTGFHQLLLLGAALGMFAYRGLRRTAASIIQTGGVAATVAFGAYALAATPHPFFWLVVAMPVIALAHLPGAPRHGAVGRSAVGLVAVTALTHAAFFGDDRYHLVITPVLCMLAAAALRAPSERAADA